MNTIFRPEHIEDIQALTEASLCVYKRRVHMAEILGAKIEVSNTSFTTPYFSTCHGSGGPLWKWNECIYRIKEPKDLIKMLLPGDEFFVRDKDHGDWVRRTFGAVISSRIGFPYYDTGGVYWAHAKIAPTTRIITIDGKDIEISDESFQALKDSFK